ncbi:ComEC/Rec2 family competence protein [Fluviicola sp.]|jgi:competence protein ComEC|uniref:ComEC/Rec2 family competence protein n=1 Tax=Fluviicola sp. TaxID=1917219 RepID=UPI00282EBE6D|nr:ComEC/Rec2 family competence protein [Fluviicola sp.]MDR0801362.1 ComEC family competence protein [Fluviicola sp.]
MPLLPLTLGLILGILLSFVSDGRADLFGLGIFLGFILLLLYLVFAGLFRKSFILNPIIIAASACCFTLMGFVKTELIKANVFSVEQVSENVNFGTVFRSAISESGYQTIHISLDKTSIGNKQITSSGNIILTLDTLEKKYETGDYVAFRTSLETFRTETNPGSFDAAYYYGTHHYIGRAFIPSNCIVKTGTRNNITTFFSKQQDQIARKLQLWLPKSVSGIGTALLLGNKAGIDPQVLDSFSNTGAMHVLAVSGLHVGIILIIFQYILQFFSRWITKKQSIIFSVVLIWAFGLLSGASPSVIRAVVMFTILTFGQLLSRKNSGMNNLLLSAVILLMYDPYYLFDIGFQLSYIALAGIFLFQNPVYRLIHIRQKWLDWFWKGSAVGIAATIATTPFMLYWFHQFPNYFLLSNIVVMLLGFVVLLFPIILVFTAWIPYFKTLIIFLTALSLQLLVIGIQFVDRVPGSLSGGFELDFFHFLILLTIIGYCTYQALIKETLSRLPFIAFACCFIFLSWKREIKLNRNEFQVFSAKQFCGIIQYEGRLISFYESSPKNKQVVQILKNAVRDSGLNRSRAIVLKSMNRLTIGNKNILFTRHKNGWRITLDGKTFNYRTRGTPGKDENKQLLSQRLQDYLYKDEQIQPFKISI